jgi:hypothetical protein
MRNKEVKRVDAESRNEAYSKLSTKEKLDKLDKLGYNATKQRAKLLKKD